MKRIVATVLCLAMVCMLLAGSVAYAADGNVNPKGVFPIVKEPITLEVAINKSARVQDLSTNEYIVWLEEQTGIHLDFMELASTDYRTQINLMMSSGDLPDLFMGVLFSYINMCDYADAGHIVPLDPYIDEYGDEFFKVLDAVADRQPNAQKLLTYDGHIYSTPSFVMSLINTFDGRMYINEQWMETLGLDYPKTLDEFHSLLTAIRDGDPNGNGLADEIPMMGSTANNVVTMIGDAFQQTDITSYLKVEDQKVALSANNEAFQNTLRYIHMLVSEGLLDPATFTQDVSVLTAIFSQADAKVGVLANNSKNSTMDASMPLYTFYPTIPYKLAGPDGFVTTPYTPPTIRRTFVITSACEYPEAAFRLADFVLSEEAGMRIRYGVPERDWIYNENEELLDFYGRPARYKMQENYWNMANQNTILRDDNSWMFLDADDRKTTTTDRSFPGEYNDTLNGNASYYFSQQYKDDAFPRDLLLDANDAIRFDELKTAIVNYVAEHYVRFITGDLSFDADWEAYVTGFERVGLSEYLALAQKALDQLNE